jgi:ketosteroid isomerase-like protein
MDTSQTKQLVMQAYQFYKAHDIKGILSLADENIEWIGPDSDFLPFAGQFHGKDQVAHFFSMLEQAQDVIEFEPQNFIAEGDKVAVTGTARWAVKTTGLTYDSPWAHIFTLRDGKIARFEQHTHTAAAEAAFRPRQGAGQETDTSLRH